MPPSPTLFPAPHRRQSGRLRWPIAWSGGVALTAALLSLLVKQLPAHVSMPPPPDTLKVSLQTPAAPLPPRPRQRPEASRRTSAPQPASGQAAADLQAAAARTSNEHNPEPVSVRPYTAASAPLPAEPGKQGDQAILSRSAETASSNIQSPTSGKVPVNANADATIQALPLAQRCPQQVKPEFPSIALDDGIEQGRVRLRLHLDTEGKVKSVEILEASPAGYFEAASRRAAMQWRCLPSGEAGGTVRVPFIFG